MKHKRNIFRNMMLTFTFLTIISVLVFPSTIIVAAQEDAKDPETKTVTTIDETITDEDNEIDIVENDTDNQESKLEATNDVMEEKVDIAINGYFDDVMNTHWAFEAINILYDNGIVSGHVDGTFKPDAHITRSEFAAIIAKAAGLTVVNDKVSSFVDVSSNSVMSPFIEAATPYMTIWKDYSNGDMYFKPDETLTRQDVVATLVRMFGIDVSGYSIDKCVNTYWDFNKIPDYAKQAFAYCIENGIIAGYSDASVRGSQEVTRAEFCTILQNMMTKHPNVEYVKLNKVCEYIKPKVDPTATIGNSNEERIWNYFINKGYSKAATAAIMGNLYQESKLDPTCIQGNGSGPGAGLAQWGNYNNKSSRWKALNDFASSYSKPWTDLGVQLAFIDYEIHNTQARYFKTCAGTTVEQWKQSTNVESATRQFENAYERAGIPAMGKRVNAAYKYYNTYAPKSSV